MILKYTENTEGLKIAQKTLDQNKVPCFSTIYIYGGTIHMVCVYIYIHTPSKKMILCISHCLMLTKNNNPEWHVSALEDSHSACPWHTES